MAWGIISPFSKTSVNEMNTMILNERTQTVIHVWNQLDIKEKPVLDNSEAVKQWFADYPEEAKKIIEISFTGQNLFTLCEGKEFFDIFPNLQKVALSYNPSLDPKGVHDAFKMRNILLVVDPALYQKLDVLRFLDDDVLYRLESAQ